MNNPLFKADATMAYDNPFFELDVDRTLDPSLELSSDRDVWSPASAPGCQTQLIEEFVDVYKVLSAYCFTFDPHVHDLFQVHSSDMHVLNMLNDNRSRAIIRSKCCQQFDLLPYEFLSPMTDGVEVDRVQHDDPASFQGVDVVHTRDCVFGKSSTLFSHDDYYLIQDLEACCILEIQGIKVAQQEAIGIGFPTVWLHQITHHNFGIEMIQQVVLVLVLQRLFGDCRDITQIYPWDPGGLVFYFVPEIAWGQAISRSANCNVPFLA